MAGAGGPQPGSADGGRSGPGTVVICREARCDALRSRSTRDGTGGELRRRLLAISASIWLWSVARRAGSPGAQASGVRSRRWAAGPMATRARSDGESPLAGAAGASTGALSPASPSPLRRRGGSGGNRRAQVVQ